jgi:Mg2+/Co2+ transporter CorC
MQSYDEQHNMLAASILPQMSGAESMQAGVEAMQARIQAELSRKEVANVVVGKLPNKGDTVTINGLVFEVKFVDYKRGTLQLKLAHYKEDTEDENGITHEAGEIVRQ